MNIEKYSRQILSKKIEKFGQKKLLDSTVVIVGMGGLGTNISSSLVRAGIGKLIIFDSDRIEESNLQRQSLFDKFDIGRKKAETAGEKLSAINSDTEIITFSENLSYENYKKIKKADIIIDAVDNLESRFLINNIAVKLKIPFLYCSVEDEEGMVGFFQKKPCFMCIFQKIEEKKEIKPILNQTVMTASAIASNEAMNYLISGKSTLKSKILYFSLKSYRFEAIPVKPNKNCDVCSK